MSMALQSPVLPLDLPVPPDDGACDHLWGARMPALLLQGTDGLVQIGSLRGWTVLYIYPRSSPDNDDPAGWDAIPGARGCSPQACAFRDNERELAALGARVLGLSSQPLTTLIQERARLHLPFHLLSDSSLRLHEAMQWPLLDHSVDQRRYYRRFTLILNGDRIEHVFYPVFPPDRNAKQVVDWFSRRQIESSRSPGATV